MTPYEFDIKNAVQAIYNGGIILYPTDTIWGIGCSALDEQAIEKVFELKQRPKEKSLIVLLAEAKDILRYVAAPHPDIISIVESFEQPTTVIYDGALEFPYNAIHENGSIAIRVTQDPLCKTLIKRMNAPLISTSANISGQESPKFYDQIDQSIIDGVDYVCEYRQTDKEERKPSRLVKIHEDGTLEIFRR